MIVLCRLVGGHAGLSAVHQRDHPAGKKPARSRARHRRSRSDKRSAHLHGPYSGDLFVRWIGAAAIAVLLVCLVIYTAVLAQGVLITDWPIHFSLEDGDVASNLDWFKLQVVYPACLWLVVVFLAVVRFLSYLDLRIRHEGWEVELLMRAEALRLDDAVGVMRSDERGSAVRRDTRFSRHAAYSVLSTQYSVLAAPARFRSSSRQRSLPHNPTTTPSKPAKTPFPAAAAFPGTTGGKTTCGG